MSRLTRIGVNLSSRIIGPRPRVCFCGKPSSCVHHDHIIDLAHMLFRRTLGKAIVAGSQETWLSRWCRERGEAFYNIIMNAEVPDFGRLVRFAPAYLCSSCNSKDGNGKVGANHPNLAWYSMNAFQCVSIAGGEGCWDEYFAKDREALGPRVAAMMRLVADELEDFSAKQVSSA